MVITFSTKIISERSHYFLLDSTQYYVLHFFLHNLHYVWHLICAIFFSNFSALLQIQYRFNHSFLLFRQLCRTTFLTDIIFSLILYVLEMNCYLLFCCCDIEQKLHHSANNKVLSIRSATSKDFKHCVNNNNNK